MKKFVIEDGFWELFPHAKIGIVICEGIDNQVKDETRYLERLQAGEKAALTYLTEAEFSNNPVVKVWRDAYTKFKTKKGARCSVEAMLKRVSNGNHIGAINPLVDIYNSISLKYALPCGGEDIDTFVGDLRLTRAVGDEDFITLGSEESAPPYEGEVIYKDDAGAVCRCWNWRESVRTMLTEKTGRAFLCIELVDETRLEALKEALSELEGLAREELGGECRSVILDKEHREILIEG